MTKAPTLHGVSTNGDPVAHDPAAPVVDRLRQALLGANGDADVFSLFADIARELDRPDLRAEFLTRAGGTTAPAPSGDARPKGTDAKSQEADAKVKARIHTGLGRKHYRDRKLAEAVTEFRQALQLDPEAPGVHCDLGVTLAGLGQLAEAEAAFHISVRLAPTGLIGYLNLTSACLDRGRPADAEQWARQAILINPASAEAHRFLGAALDGRNQNTDAEAAFREAVRLKPDLADAHYGLGGVLLKTARAAEAETAYREATKLRPTHAPSWRGLCRSLEELGKPADAERCGQEAVRLDPKSHDAHNNLGVVLAALDRPTEAEACYREALRLKPKFAVALSNLGNALRAQGKLTESEATLRDAVRLQPKSAEAHNNLGIALVQQGRIDDGLLCYDEAIRLRSDYPEARLNRALSLLLTGEFERGWADYEWRWKMRHVKAQVFDVPMWDGSLLPGKTILLRSEQGLGDTLQFVRYAPLVKARCGQVVVDCPEILTKLVETCPGVDRAVPRGQGLPKFDVQVSLMSLPGLLGGVPPTVATPAIPYFTPPADRVAFWRDELAGVDGFRVGIVWQGSKTHKGDRIRSVSLARFAGLAAVPGVRLVSLQKGPGAEQVTDGSAAGFEVLDLGARTAAGMEDAAAVLANLDLLVTVDTAVAHLAGGIGVPVWVAIPFAPDWRWMRNREDTPWYPTMRLFRQQAVSEWDDVFERFRAALVEVVRKLPNGRCDRG